MGRSTPGEPPFPSPWKRLILLLSVTHVHAKTQKRDKGITVGFCVPFLVQEPVQGPLHHHQASAPHHLRRCLGMYQEGDFWVSQVVFLRVNLKNVKSLPLSAFGQLLSSSHRGEFGAGIWILRPNTVVAEAPFCSVNGLTLLAGFIKLPGCPAQSWILGQVVFGSDSCLS